MRRESIGDFPVARLTLERAGALNCIDEALAEEFRHACRSVEQADDFRLVIVTGSGECFSAGREYLDEGDASVSDRLAGLKVADSLASLEIPVIVALNGDATGQGLELAVAGDLRVAVDTTHFALWSAAMPVFPWDGGTQRLSRLVGQAWALDMALTGRRVDAVEALSLGLVNRVVPQNKLEAETRSLAEQVLATGPVAVRYVKETVYKGLDLTLEQGMRLEADLSVILQSTADRAEGISSFMEKRRPRFKGS